MWIALQGAARDGAPLSESAPVAKRDTALDEVNLNVDGDAGVTMTFVETVGGDDDEK